MIPVPFEIEYPEAGKILAQICLQNYINNKMFFPTTKIHISFYHKNDMRRNARCACGSGKKFRKCCGE